MRRVIPKTEDLLAIGGRPVARPAVHPRAGWAEDARRIAECADNRLVIGDFGNQGDDERTW